MPDGGSGDRLRPSPPKYDIRPRTPERPAALSSTKKDLSHSCQVDRMKYERLERSEMELSRKEPSRTSSAEIDYRSMPSYASDLTKTMPTLSGRSKGQLKVFYKPLTCYHRQHAGYRLFCQGSCEKGIIDTTYPLAKGGLI